MGESISCHADDLDQAVMTGLCEVDGALLMEDLPSTDLLLDGDVDRQLSHVIRSLEAEIGGESGEAAAVMMSDEGGESLDRIEDVLLLSDDMGGYDYEEEGASSSSFGYWPQVVSSSSSLLAGHDDAEGWCVYTNNGYEGGGVLGYDTVDHQHYYYCCAEGSAADHMYLPLWE